MNFTWTKWPLSHSSQSIPKVAMHRRCYLLEFPTAPISSILSPGHQADVLVCIYFSSSTDDKGGERGYTFFGTRVQARLSQAFFGNVSFNDTIQYIVCITRRKRMSFRIRGSVTKKDSQERNGKGSTNLHSVIMFFKDKKPSWNKPQPVFLAFSL